MTKTKLQSRGVEALRAGVLKPKMVILILIAITLMIATAVLIVWTRNQVVATGYEISRANEKLSALTSDNRNLNQLRYRKINLQALQESANALGLKKPTSDQMIVVYDDSITQK